MRINLICFICLLFILSSCYQSKKIKIATSLKGSASERVGNELAAYLKDRNWDVEIFSGTEYNGSRNINLIREGKMDLAFVPNDLAHSIDTKDIKTVLPIYPNLNYILYKDTLDPKNLEDLMSNNPILIYEDDESFYMNLFNYYGLNTSVLNIKKLKVDETLEEIRNEVKTGQSNVLCFSAAIDSPYVNELLNNGWEIFSLGDINHSGAGASVDGFCMKYPRTRPFIIPKNFFGKKPENPVYTVLLNEIIITQNKMDDRIIYDFAEDILNGKHFLSQNEVLFTYLSESFNRDGLNFPLHEGTINFLDRNKPSLFERYSGALGVLISILVILAGSLTSLKKIRKDRIDKYYKRVMNCNNIDELQKISDEAVMQLQNEKLTADESFTIFMKLVEKKRENLQTSSDNLSLK